MSEERVDCCYCEQRPILQHIGDRYVIFCRKPRYGCISAWGLTLEDVMEKWNSDIGRELERKREREATAASAGDSDAEDKGGL